MSAPCAFRKQEIGLHPCDHATVKVNISGTVLYTRTRRCNMRGRPHNRELKLTIVRQLASGEKRPAQVCREHNLAPSLVARWRQEYEIRGEAAFAPLEPTPTQALEAKVAELERFCGQLAVENAVLKKALQQLPSRNGTR